MNNMAYENNNVRAGANGAGVYVGNTEIMGGGMNITPLNLYSDSSATDVLLANLTDAVATFKFYFDNSLIDTIICQPFEVQCIGDFSDYVNQFNVSCGDNTDKYQINTSIRKVASCKDSYGDVYLPEFTLVDNADEHFANGMVYNSNIWEYINQSTNKQESFAGGWIVLTMDI